MRMVDRVRRKGFPGFQLLPHLAITEKNESSRQIVKDVRLFADAVAEELQEENSPPAFLIEQPVSSKTYRPPLLARLPYGFCWMECERGVWSGEINDRLYPATRFGCVGIRLTSADAISFALRRSAETANLEKTVDEITRLILFTQDQNKKLIGPWGFLDLLLNSGEKIGQMGSPLNLPFHLLAGQTKTAEAIRECARLEWNLIPFLNLVAILNCVNAVVSEVSAKPPKSVARQIRRGSRDTPVSWRTVTIQPKTRSGLDRNGDLSRSCDSQPKALHQVRGHWVDHRKAGLFGKPTMRGVFWVPEHHRGAESAGRVRRLGYRLGASDSSPGRTTLSPDIVSGEFVPKVGDLDIHDERT